MSAELKQILTVVVPELRKLGYNGSGQNFRLTTSDACSVVNFQKDSGGERFFVNVGVHPTCLLTGGTSAVTTSLKEHDCMFRTRLPPPDEYKFGWPYRIEIADGLSARFRALFIDWIKPLMTIPGPVTFARAADLQGISSHPLFGTMNPAKFEKFANICIARDSPVAAAEFIHEALSIAPPSAKGLIRHLKRLLSELEG